MKSISVIISHPYEITIDERDVTSALANYFKKHQFAVTKINLMTAVIKKTRNGQYRFNLIADNGEKIATGETYIKKQKAIQTLSKCFPDFTIVDKTK